MAEYQKAPQQMQQQGPPPMPKPPRKQPYHDGISRSAQHYDLFETVRRPYAGISNRPPEPPPRPHIGFEPALTKQQKIQKDVQARFEKANHRLPRFNFIEGMTKWLFILLILPPYFLLLRLPEVIFLYISWALSYLFTQVKQLAKRIGKIFGSYYTNGITKFNQILINPICQGVNSIKSKIVNFFKSLWNFPLNTYQKIKAYKNQLSLKIHLSLQKYRKSIKRQWTMKIVQPCQRMKNLILSPFLQIAAWYKYQVQRGQKWGKSLIKKAVVLKEAILHPWKTLKNITLRLQTPLIIWNKILRNSFVRYYHSIVKSLQTFKNVITLKISQIVQKIKRVITLVVSYPKSVLKSLQQISKNAAEGIKKLFKLLKVMGSKAMAPWNKLEKWIQVLSPVKKTKSLYNQSSIRIKGIGKKSLSGVQSFAHPSFKSLGKLLQLLWSRSKSYLKSSKKMIQPCLKPLQKAQGYLQKLTLQVRLSLAWAIVLAHFSMGHVRLLADKAAYTISLTQFYSF
jgi:hypothetical protein